MVNVKQIIKYGEKTTEKEPTVLRQHMLIRYGLVHYENEIKKQKQKKKLWVNGNLKRNEGSRGTFGL